MISKAQLAQRARRERERNLKQGSAYQLGQLSQVERTDNCVQSVPHPRSPSLTPSCRPLNCLGQGSMITQSVEKRQKVAQTSTSLSFMSSTSSPPQMNW